MEGVRLALGIVFGALALISFFVAMLLFFSSEETWEKTPWQAVIPGLDVLWLLAAPFANWRESPMARKCVYTTVLSGTLAVILINC